MQALLSLAEFAALAAKAVEASGAAPGNRQAKAVPAERMIRYYTARGLLPRPGNRGRALTYGRTHVLRLVAIKRLQGQGLSLDEIADRLDAMAADEVESLAAIPPGVLPEDLGDVPGDPAPARSSGRFWRTAPAAPVAPPVQAVRLSDTVTLLVDGGPLPEVAALRRAAAPLLDLLNERTAHER
ncbi:MerR family transcriptional regulator [Mycobacterium sp. 1423905.2]|uniref:MerR family transcriptional regulator n=1 Tax=Mycobacterium sp. 1423905.2 TaxID=1856859 RepID=UPI0007FC0527|nr:MerR family transcriptional regulator [Mycobacterium sp. 1423905.2]OBJ57037.1 transcriptional regulator [Mycobacterium sp. 1423905.2]